MKKKLHTRFPATRIKKIMQTDEDVGKIAMAVPLLLKLWSYFCKTLCNHTYDVTLSRGAKTVNSFHLKQCVHGFNVFDFLKEIVGKVPDLGGSETEDQSATKRRKVVDESSCNDEDTKTTQMCDTGGGRGRRGRGRGRGGGRTGISQSLKFEDDVEEEDVTPRSSRSPSSENDEKKPECVQYSSNSGSKVRDFDLNVGLDENGDFATSLERRLEGIRGWPMNEMKIDAYRDASSANEEDYDEE